MSLPNDANGQVLRRMAEQGDDLTVPRPIDFEHVLPSLRAAEEMARRARDLGYGTNICRRGLLSRGRNLTCTREMLPTHAAITEAEQTLAAVARELGGHEDGWGCFQSE